MPKDDFDIVLDRTNKIINIMLKLKNLSINNDSKEELLEALLTYCPQMSDQLKEALRNIPFYAEN